MAITPSYSGLVKVEPGKFYFVAVCRNTHRYIPFAEDPSSGRRPYGSPTTELSCLHCPSTHRFEGSEILSLQALEEEG